MFEKFWEIKGREGQSRKYHTQRKYSRGVEIKLISNSSLDERWDV
jgi:hypothetical protein